MEPSVGLRCGTGYADFYTPYGTRILTRQQKQDRPINGYWHNAESPWAFLGVADVYTSLGWKILPEDPVV